MSNIRQRTFDDKNDIDNLYKALDLESDERQALSETVSDLSESANLKFDSTSGVTPDNLSTNLIGYSYNGNSDNYPYKNQWNVIANVVVGNDKLQLCFGLIDKTFKSRFYINNEWTNWE